MGVKKYSDELIDEAYNMKSCGMTIKEVSQKIKVPYGTVYSWISQRAHFNSNGLNSDRHLCRMCMYRMTTYEKNKTGGNCNFIEIVGHSRGCNVDLCDKFKKGKAMIHSFVPKDPEFMIGENLR